MNLRPLLVAVALLPATGCGLVGFEVVSGSGNPITQGYEVKGFTNVEAHSAFEVDIRQGDKFDVSVTTDDNLLEFVRVDEQGDTLTISVEPGKNLRPRAGMKAQITLPALESVRLQGACTGHLEGTWHAKDFKAEVQGASKLNGDIVAETLQVQAHGASTVKLKGKANQADLKAHGASTLDMGDCTIQKATIAIHGASSGTVNVLEAIDYQVNGASTLKYKGHPKVGEHEVHGASSVSEK